MVSQKQDYLSVSITDSTLKNVTWSETKQFPIVDPDLARIYFKSTVYGLAGNPTAGTGFKQTLRRSPQVVISDKFIQIYEAAKMIVL